MQPTTIHNFVTLHNRLLVGLPPFKCTVSPHLNCPRTARTSHLLNVRLVPRPLSVTHGYHQPLQTRRRASKIVNPPWAASCLGRRWQLTLHPPCTSRDTLVGPTIGLRSIDGAGRHNTHNEAAALKMEDRKISAEN